MGKKNVEKLKSQHKIKQVLNKQENDNLEINKSFTVISNEKNMDHPIIGQEPWPDDVKLYQPYETEQILLPDMANCLAVRTYLKMCHLKFEIEYRINAEDMSPSGRVPFIKCGSCLVSDLEPITNFVANKGASLTTHLDAAQKSDMRAYMSLVNTVLGNAENYLTWVDNTTYTEITKKRYGSVHPFPLNHILSYIRRRDVIKRLTALGWYEKNLDKVYQEVDRACSALCERLEDSKFFFGDHPCELDALIFGHIFTILTTPCFEFGDKLAIKLRSYRPLIEHCKRVMPYGNHIDNIELPVYHQLYWESRVTEKDNDNYKNNIKNHQHNNEELEQYQQYEDDFICSDSESDNISGSNFQDCTCLFNEKNTIYESIFFPSCQELTFHEE